MSSWEPQDHAPVNETATESQKQSPGKLKQAGGVIWAILRQRCPRCRKGQMFRGRFAMNDPCPVCGLLFQREEGTFLGAMYASYILGSALIFPMYFLISWLLPACPDLLVAVLAILIYLPMTPMVFRYSRVLWVYFERWSFPTDVSATAYEKYRLSQIAEQKARASSADPDLQ